MKEASGELSMTAVAVVAIAAIGVVFTTLIWPSIKANIQRSTYCSQSFSCGTCSANGQAKCKYCPNSNGSVSCGDPQEIDCPCK
jgi:hypothetical protein